MNATTTLRHRATYALYQPSPWERQDVRWDYDQVYTKNPSDAFVLCQDQPARRSLSVGDYIVIWNEAGRTIYRVDPVGFSVVSTSDMEDYAAQSISYIQLWREDLR